MNRNASFVTLNGHYHEVLFSLFQGVTIVKPIVYGNVARYFGKKREEDGHTHQWTVHVKPYKNEVSRCTVLSCFWRMNYK